MFQFSVKQATFGKRISGRLDFYSESVSMYFDFIDTLMFF